MSEKELITYRETVDWLVSLGCSGREALIVVSFALQTSLSIPVAFAILTRDRSKDEEL